MYSPAYWHVRLLYLKNTSIEEIFLSALKNISSFKEIPYNLEFSCEGEAYLYNVFAMNRYQMLLCNSIRTDHFCTYWNDSVLFFFFLFFFLFLPEKLSASIAHCFIVVTILTTFITVVVKHIWAVQFNCCWQCCSFFASPHVDCERGYEITLPKLIARHDAYNYISYLCLYLYTFTCWTNIIYYILYSKTQLHVKQ